MHGRDSCTSPSRKGVSAFSLKTRVVYFMDAALKCLTLSFSIVTLTQSPTHSLLFSLSLQRCPVRSESIIEYRSRFDGLTLELAHCKVVIQSILLMILFLRALHVWYGKILNQFWMHFKPIETPTHNSIISNVTYHDGFQVMDHSK